MTFRDFIYFISIHTFSYSVDTILETLQVIYYYIIYVIITTKLISVVITIKKKCALFSIPLHRNTKNRVTIRIYRLL